jgi:hypothetical protein
VPPSNAKGIRDETNLGRRFGGGDADTRGGGDRRPPALPGPDQAWRLCHLPDRGQAATEAVTKFYFFDLKLTCEKAPQGASKTIKISNKSPLNFPVPPMAIKNGQFHGSFYKEEFKTRGEVTGAFSDQGQKAAGTLRVHGRPLGSAYGNCDSGTVRWNAKKQ